VRHGYPWVPTDQAHGRPRQVGPAHQKTRHLLVGPTDLVGGPHDLLKTFQKIPRTTLSRREDSLACKTRQSNGLRQVRKAFHDVNRLELGFPIVTDLDSSPPTLSIAQYKAGKGALLGADQTTSTSAHVPHIPPEIEAIQTEELDVGFYSPRARTSIKSPCPCVSS
jgi:hypothetical protein